jgi:3'(2'), 5'-bisphosphate nucleotidase
MTQQETAQDRSMQSNYLQEEMALAMKVAREAGTIVNTFYVGSSEVEYKLPDEPVTEADRSANQHIVSRIQAAYPNDGLLSEESQDNLERLQQERVWIIDPLDGTKEFIARNGEFSIMIGLAINGRPVLGVIHQPESGLLYTGIVGHGAYLYEENEKIPLVVSTRNELRQMVLVSSRSHRKQIVDDIRRALRITSERRTGSVGLKVGQIARQLADIYIHPSPGCKEWDICAPEAVLRAAGGEMTDCWGNPLIYNKRDVRAHNGIIATNNTIHSRIMETVSRIVEEAGYNEDDGFW